MEYIEIPKKRKRTKQVINGIKDLVYTVSFFFFFKSATKLKHVRLYFLRHFMVIQEQFMYFAILVFYSDEDLHKKRSKYNLLKIYYTNDHEIS